MWGKSPQPSSIEGWAIFSDGRKRNMCHFLDGNRLCANSTPSFGGELATNEPYAHFAGGRAAFERGQVRNEAAASWAYGGPFPLYTQNTSYF